MLAFNAEAVVVIFLLCFEQLRSLRPPGLVRDTYCGECPVKETSSVEDWECYKVPEGKETHWCCKCRAGTYPSKPCRDSEPTTTTCTPCPTDTYTSGYNNVTECFKSRQFCDNLPNTKFVRGSASENNKCVCISGTYSQDPENLGCKPYWECPKGFGVLTPGNSSHDVVCEYCKAGYCSTRKSSVEKCTPCSDDGSSNVTSSTDSSIIFEYSTTITTPRNNTPLMYEDVQCTDTTGFIVAIVILSLAFVVAVSSACYCWRKQKGNRHGKPNANGNVQDSEMHEMKPFLPSGGSKMEDNAQPVSQSESKAHERESFHSLTIDPKIYSESQVENKAAPPPQKRDLKSKKTLTFEQYANIFHGKGWRIVFDPEGDGHCQFNALAWFLNFYKIGMEEWDGKILRRVIVNYIQRNREQYIEFMDQPFDEYLTQMKHGKYGDEITLRAAANIFKKEMLVIQTSNNINTSIVPSYDISNLDQKIIFGHIDENHGMHYVCLEPENSGNPSSPDNQVNASGDPNRQFPSDQQENGSSSDRPAQNRTQSASTDHSTGEPSQQRLILMSVSSDVQPELSAINETSSAAPSEQPPAEVDLAQEVLNFCKQDQTFETDDDTLRQNILELLEKSEIGHKMIDTLLDHKYMDVKNCLRYLGLLTEVELSDIEEDYKGNVEEIRRQWIRKVKSKHSRKLTPRYILNLEYQYAIFRDKMLVVFRKELKEVVLPSSP